MSQDEVSRFRGENGMRLPSNQNTWTLESTDMTAAQVQQDMDRRNGTNNPRSRFDRPEYRWASPQPANEPTVISATSNSVPVNAAPVNTPTQTPEPTLAPTTASVAAQEHQEVPQPQGTPLQMLHACFITPPQHGNRYPHCDVGDHISYIPHSTHLYRYGGPVVRVEYFGVPFDIMSCVRTLCTFCQNYESYTRGQLVAGEVEDFAGQRADLHAAMEDPAIDVDGSPFKGLPFVYKGKDITGNKFEPMIPEKGVRTYDVPDQTREMWFMFDDRGNQANGMLGYRKALACWPNCDVCRVAVNE